MCRLIESIKILDRKIYNVEYHNKRMNKSRKSLFNCKDDLNLLDYIEIPEGVSKGLYKCRVLYSEIIESIEFIPYRKKKINSVALIEDNFLSYEYKYEDRNGINGLLSKTNADEIIIVKNNFLTDASFANIVLSDGNTFLTPSTPLLKGTKRAQLLDEGIIKEEELKKDDIKKFKFLYLINAMLDITEEDKIPTEKIYFERIH
ncbi:MAG: aminotransferase class IV [Melioribacter sp.]|nr:aminotransferase class IV [Melioribacter sp.]